MRRVIVIDTSILCCLLRVPGKDTAGEEGNKWDYGRANEVMQREIEGGATLVLPIATLIETGNHIAQCSGNRYDMARELTEYLRGASSASSPWAYFHEQSVLWGESGIESLADEWPTLAASKLSIGDATIKAVAEYYAQAGFEVVIVTGDDGLKAYEPVIRSIVPRRRGGK